MTFAQKIAGDTGVTFAQKKENMVQSVYDISIVTNKYKWNSSLNKTETSKGQTGSNSSKLKKTVRSSKVSLSEKTPIEQIKDASIWHTRY